MAAAMYTAETTALAEARASALKEWETVEVEDLGGSGAEHVRRETGVADTALGTGRQADAYAAVQL